MQSLSRWFTLLTWLRPWVVEKMRGILRKEVTLIQISASPAAIVSFFLLMRYVFTRYQNIYLFIMAAVYKKSKITEYSLPNI
jgi:hypothetical protein